MRAWTAPAFLEDFFPADLDFLAPPVALTFPEDWDWLSLARALDPFSCLKMDSMVTKAVLPSLWAQLAVEATTPWDTFPELLKEEMSGMAALAPEAAAVTCP